jgi:chromosome segregation ATPase
MSNLIDEITQADQNLEAAEIRVSEASRRLRAAKRELKDCRSEIRLLIKELKTGQSRYPVFERIERSKGTADEHQRGPTVFPKVQSSASAS